jgi:hypothetical protein
MGLFRNALKCRRWGSRKHGAKRCLFGAVLAVSSLQRYFRRYVEPITTIGFQQLFHSPGSDFAHASIRILF